MANDKDTPNDLFDPERAPAVIDKVYQQMLYLSGGVPEGYASPASPITYKELFRVAATLREEALYMFRLCTSEHEVTLIYTVLRIAFECKRVWESVEVGLMPGQDSLLGDDDYLVKTHLRDLVEVLSEVITWFYEEVPQIMFLSEPLRPIYRALVELER